MPGTYVSYSTIALQQRPLHVQLPGVGGSKAAKGAAAALLQVLGSGGDAVTPTSQTQSKTRGDRSFWACQGLFGLNILLLVYGPVNQGVKPVLSLLLYTRQGLF